MQTAVLIQYSTTKQTSCKGRITFEEYNPSEGYRACSNAWMHYPHDDTLCKQALNIKADEKVKEKG
jgi:hypothetical protein